MRGVLIPRPWGLHADRIAKFGYSHHERIVPIDIGSIIGATARTWREAMASQPLYSTIARRRVNIASALLGLVIGVVAGVLLVFIAPSARRDETVTTTDVTETSIGGNASPATKTSTTKQTVLAASDTSAITQTLDHPAVLVLLRVAVIALAAFIAGAVLQRLLLGEYGLTIGPLTIPALPAVDAAAAASAVNQVTGSPSLSGVLPLGPGPLRPQALPIFLSIEDPQLKFLSIRAEVEDKLRSLAMANGIDRDVPLRRAVGRLREAGVLDEQAEKGLLSLIELGDQAARGAQVPPETVDAISEQAMRVIFALGQLRERSRVAEAPPQATEPSTDDQGRLTAITVPFQDEWVEVLAARDGRPLLEWSDSVTQWPDSTGVVRDDTGRTLVMIQIVQIGDRVLTFAIPASTDRNPLLVMKAIVDADQQVAATFQAPGSGPRVLPLTFPRPPKS